MDEHFWGTIRTQCPNSIQRGGHPWTTYSAQLHGLTRRCHMYVCTQEIGNKNIYQPQHHKTCLLRSQHLLFRQLNTSIGSHEYGKCNFILFTSACVGGCRGVQYVHWVMHKCIMVKVGGEKIHTKYVKSW